MLNVHKSFRQTRPTALIYGAGFAGRQLATGLFSNNEILVKGFIDDYSRLQGRTTYQISVHSNAGLQDLIHRLNITYVLLAIHSVSQRLRSEIIASLNGCEVRLRALPGLSDLASGRFQVSDL